MPVSESMKSIISAAGPGAHEERPRKLSSESVHLVALQPDDDAERAHVHEEVGEEIEQHG